MAKKLYKGRSSTKKDKATARAAAERQIRDREPAKELRKTILQRDLTEKTKAAFEWLEGAGIPCLPRAQKMKGISASGATQKVLGADYRWRFHSIWKQVDSDNNFGTKALTKLSFREVVTTIENVYTKIGIVKDWKVETLEDLSEKVAQAVHLISGPRVTVTSEFFECQMAIYVWAMDKLVKKDEGILYQTPIFQDESESESTANLILPIRKLLRTSMEDTAASDLRALRSTIDVLGLDKAANIVSEITVERYWGKVLPHIFVEPGTFLCSNTSLVYPPDFNCWDSAPQPDLGTRLILPNSYLTPVLLVGEAKTLATKELDIRAQMACAAHPTLQLFVSHLTKKYKDEETEKWDKDFDPFAQGDKQGQIPEHMCVYGVRYDQKGIKLCMFFPSYTLVPKDGSVMGPSGNDEAQEDPDGEDEVTYRDHSNDPRKMKVVWQYNCLDIDEFRSASELAILGTDTWLSSRILLLVVGLVLKKQLQKTLEALKREPLQLPEQLTELDKAFVALRKDSK